MKTMIIFQILEPELRNSFVKKHYLSPSMWEDGKRKFFLLSNWRIWGIYGSGYQRKREVANCFKRCPPSENAYQSQENRLDPLGKVCRKDWHKRFIVPLGLCPEGWRAVFCYGHFKDPFCGSLEILVRWSTWGNPRSPVFWPLQKHPRFGFHAPDMKEYTFQIFCLSVHEGCLIAIFGTT